MKLASFSDGSGSRVGIVRGEGLIDVRRHLADSSDDLRAVIERWEYLRPKFQAIETQDADIAVADVRLLAPVQSPQKILCIGLNYADHCAEAGLERPKNPMWFCKVPTSAAAPFAEIELPAASDQLDYEAELVVVIGKRCRNVPKARANEVIFGYCVGNDVSVRDWQRRTTQIFIGKAFDGHAPFGPWVTSANGLDPHSLDIRCTVNGEVRQNSNTRHLIFDCFDQIANLSQAMTLVPGDIIFTGTPGGVGTAMKPPKYLAEGDRVRVEIQELGAIEGRVKRGNAETSIG